MLEKLGSGQVGVAWDEEVGELLVCARPAAPA
ncbi:hypothetical protein HNQ09_002008 [Deinococcus budaensis]|uniref:Uncharacterized protein n=1 Tax=Deinococcus budaensis TaxID=1665626 RepID=A0A7W8GFE0_9DEIO|nr:hypothetical protein [Deinococcus budaensis]